MSEGMSGLFGMDKMKREKLKLVPEADWLLMNPDPVNIIIKVPMHNDHGPNWNFMG